MNLKRLQKKKTKSMKRYFKFMNALPFSHPQHKICLYAGRFQPFHLGHYKTFLELCKTCLGNCYIVTSDKEETGTSPFNFEDKKFIIETLFPDLKGKVIQERVPYVPRDELFDNTIRIFALGEKDSERFKIGLTKAGKPTYFQHMTPTLSQDHILSQDHAYIQIIPPQTIIVDGKEINISGTYFREKWIEIGDDKDKQTDFIKKYYQLSDDSISEDDMDKLINIFNKI